MTVLQWGGYLLWLMILIFSFPREGWRKYKSEKDYQHLVMATVVVLSLLWSLRAGISEGLQVHFLALTALVLIHGWRITVLISLFPVLLLAMFGLIHWQDIGLYSLVGVVLPAMFSCAVFLLSYRYLARHLFIYIFIAAFMNGALAMIVYLLLTSGWNYLSGAYSWQYIVDNYLTILPLLLFPEALLNGMVMTLMVVYKPEWVRTFSDHDYIDSSDKKKK